MVKYIIIGQLAVCLNRCVIILNIIKEKYICLKATLEWICMK